MILLWRDFKFITTVELVHFLSPIGVTRESLHFLHSSWQCLELTLNLHAPVNCSVKKERYCSEFGFSRFFKSLPIDYFGHFQTNFAHCLDLVTFQPFQRFDLFLQPSTTFARHSSVDFCQFFKLDLDCFSHVKVTHLILLYANFYHSRMLYLALSSWLTIPSEEGTKLLNSTSSILICQKIQSLIYQLHSKLLAKAYIPSSELLYPDH